MSHLECVSNEYKEMEESELLIKSKHFKSKYFEGKKRKYPFYEKIDLEIDLVVQSIFSETVDIVSKLLNQPKQKPSSNKIETIEIDDIKIEEIDDYDEKQIMVEVKETKETEEIEEIETLPLTQIEIRNERRKYMKLLETKDKLSPYEEKLIDIICKEFELIYFRSPSLKEISLILSKSMQKIEKCQENVENITPNTMNSSLLENGEHMMLDYVMFIKTHQPNEPNEPKTKTIV
eukprot:UN10112